MLSEGLSELFMIFVLTYTLLPPCLKVVIQISTINKEYQGPGQVSKGNNQGKIVTDSHQTICACLLWLSVLSMGEHLVL